MSEQASVGVAGGEMAVGVEGEGPTVLLVHGIPGSAGSWDAVREGLVGAGYRVLVPDLLGFGGSSRPEAVDELWIDAQVGALARVLDRMADGPAVVVGHDYGAPMAVTLARRESQRVSGLVVAAGNLFTDTPIPGPLKLLALPRLGPAVARVALSGPALRLMLRFGTGTPRPRLDPARYLGDRGQQASIRRIFTAALQDLPRRYADVAAALSELGVPTVVIWGDQDPFFPLSEGRRAADAIPGAELETAEGAGHFLPAERPELFVKAVGRVQGAARRVARRPVRPVD